MADTAVDTAAARAACRALLYFSSPATVCWWDTPNMLTRTVRQLHGMGVLPYANGAVQVNFNS